MGLHQEVGLAIDVVILVFQTSKCVPRPPYSRAMSSTVRPRFNLLQQSNELRLRAFCGGEAYDPLNKHYAGLAPTLNLCDSLTTLGQLHHHGYIKLRENQRSRTNLLFPNK